MLLHVTHETHYDYSPAVETAQHMVHLKPRNTDSQRLQSHHLSVEPAPANQTESVDLQGNTRSFFELGARHESLVVCARSLVQTHVPQPPTPATRQVGWEPVRERFRYRAGALYDSASAFRFSSPYVPQDDTIDAYARASFSAGRSAFDAVSELNLRIYNEFKYDAESTEVNTPAVLALAQRRGVCQDFAHIMIACLRGMGLPARYVSGYLLTHPPAGQPRMVGADASHAWISAWFPEPNAADAPDASCGGQWIDFDPTNGRCAGEDYVTLAIGRDFSDVSPMRGVLHGGASHTLEVRVTVEPLPPGVTAPQLVHESVAVRAAAAKAKAAQVKPTSG